MFKRKIKFIMFGVMFFLSFNIVLSKSYEKYRSLNNEKEYISQKIVNYNIIYASEKKKEFWNDLSDMNYIYFIPTHYTYKVDNSWYPVYLSNISNNNIKLSMVSGRLFNKESDKDESLAIINKTLQNKLKSNYIYIEKKRFRIVGVMEDYGLSDSLTFPIYLNKGLGDQGVTFNFIDIGIRKSDSKNVNKELGPISFEERQDKSFEGTISEGDLSIQKLFINDYLSLFLVSFISLVILVSGRIIANSYSIGIQKMIGIRDRYMLYKYGMDTLKISLLGLLGGVMLQILLNKLFPSIFPTIYKETCVYIFSYFSFINIFSISVMLVYLKKNDAIVLLKKYRGGNYD